MGQYWIEIDLDDLRAFDEDLFEDIYKHPVEYLGLFEEAATEVADEVTHPRPADDEDAAVKHIQVLMRKNK
jgi:DNA replication licensing factor MCM5